MIIALATDDRSLFVFGTEPEAASYCEGVDVENGDWLFWDANGQPLKACFTIPNEHGFMSLVSGRYQLVPAQLAEFPSLAAEVSAGTHLQPNPFFASYAQLLSHVSALAASRTGA